MKRKWKFLLSLLFALFLLYFFLRGIDFKLLILHLKKAEVFPLVFFVFSIPFLYFLRAVRWRVLFMDKNTSLSSFTIATVLGFAISYTLPGRIGELARALYVAKKEEVSAPYSLATVVIERIFDAVSVGFMLFLYLITSPSIMKGYRSSFWTPLLVVGGLFFLLVAFVLLLKTSFFRDLLKKPFRLLLSIFPARYQDKLKNAALSFLDGMNFLFPVKKFLLFFTGGIVIWAFIVFQYWVAMSAFGIDKNYFEFIPYIAVLVIGAAIPTPGMAGGFDVASRLFMEKIWNYSGETAVAATFVIHVLLVGVTILLGAFAGMKEGISLARQEK